MTLVPAPSGVSSNSHRVESGRRRVGNVRHARRCGASTSSTSHTRDHRVALRRLRPRKRAPFTGPLAPSSHSTPRHSTLHSPVLVTSDTKDHTASTGASTTTDASQDLPTRKTTRSSPCPTTPSMRRRRTRRYRRSRYILALPRESTLGEARCTLPQLGSWVPFAEPRRTSRGEVGHAHSEGVGRIGWHTGRRRTGTRPCGSQLGCS